MVLVAVADGHSDDVLTSSFVDVELVVVMVGANVVDVATMTMMRVEVVVVVASCAYLKRLEAHPSMVKMAPLYHQCQS